MTNTPAPHHAAALAPWRRTGSIHASVSQHVSDDDLYAIDVPQQRPLIFDRTLAAPAPPPGESGEALMTGLQARLAGLVAGVR